MVPEPSCSWCLPLYLSPTLPFCTMLLRLISVALSSYSMHHSSCFAGWGPTETDFSVHHHYGDVQQQSNSWIISGPNIQRDDIITSWSFHSCLHLSFFLQPNRKFTVSGISSTELSMTRTKSRRQPLTQLWRAPTPFSALPNQLAIAEKMTLLVLSWISVCILLLCKRFKYRFI